jgi:hypothetical protein
MEFIKKCGKGWHMNCSESFYKEAFQQQVLLINKQNVDHFDPTSTVMQVVH